MNVKQFASDNKSLIGLLILMLLVSLVSPSFFSVDNLLNILRQTSINGIIAMGMTDVGSSKNEIPIWYFLSVFTEALP